VNPIQTTKEFVLDTLFPINCLGCGRDNLWFCEDCQKNTELLSFQKCPLCENNITESGFICQKCKPSPHLDALLASVRYKDAHIGKLIHLYKYKFIEDLHIPLGNLLLKMILSSKFPLPDMIIPVPLHPRRLRWRGFNQSQLLAEYIGKNIASGFEIPVCENILSRKKYTSPQMKIKKYSQRISNLEQAFSIRDGGIGDLKDKTIFLVDDICTTGATMFACAKALKASGAKKVFGIVIARQEIDP
jgi:ComF family protein